MKQFCLMALRIYMSFSAGLRPRCRFWPSCSRYTYEAIETHGVARGLGWGLRRVLRCHPLGGHGFDPVPPRK